MLPSDCDGGPIDRHKMFKHDHVLADHTPDYPGPCEGCVDVTEAHDDQIMSLCDETDNRAMIARDLCNLMERWKQLPFNDAGGPREWKLIYMQFAYLADAVEGK